MLIRSWAGSRYAQVSSESVGDVVRLPRAFMVQLECCLMMAIIWRWHKVFQLRAEIELRELECILV
jgi:hypothetical protein